MDFKTITEVRDLAHAAHYANWLQSIRLRAVPMRQLSTAQKELAERHEILADAWDGIRRTCDRQIREIVESFR